MNRDVTEPDPPEKLDSLATEARAFLDDFALMTVGSGGPKNVSAACMELNKEGDLALVVRVARNEGVSDDMFHNLRSTINEVI